MAFRRPSTCTALFVKILPISKN
ncbi:hypothetical protein CCACVL1_01175, partial [Corchorus capsularis]